MPTVPAHPYRDHWLFSGVLHRGARRVAWVLQLARVLTIWWPFGVLQQISQRERGSIFVASMATLLVTSGLKQWNTTSCPWDLVDFGGPARAAWICFATALLAGITVGLAQQIRGAHYLSHTLWTAWLCWFVTLACYGFLTRDRGGPGSQHADGHNLNIVLTVKAHIHGVTPFAPAMSHVDIPLFLWINASSASPAWLLALARFASQELVQWLIAATVGALVVGDAQVRRCVLQVAIAMVIAWIGARLIQHLLPMPRPFALGLGTPWLSHADSAGFPSTHASVAFAFAAIVAANARRRLLGVCAFALAGLIAWSRVSLGLHFPSDVVAGALVGLASSWLVGRFPPRTQALSAT